MGRPSNLERDAWQLRFNISPCNPRRGFTDDLLCQLSHCKSDEARRLILGVSRKSKEPIAEKQMRMGRYA